MTTKLTQYVSISMQELANAADKYLHAIAGKRQSFVIIVADSDGVAHDVYNCSKADAKTLLEGQIKHWDDGKAEIPAHYNPDLPK